MLTQGNLPRGHINPQEESYAFRNKQWLSYNWLQRECSQGWWIISGVPERRGKRRDESWHLQRKREGAGLQVGSRKAWAREAQPTASTVRSLHLHEAARSFPGWEVQGELSSLWPQPASESQVWKLQAVRQLCSLQCVCLKQDLSGGSHGNGEKLMYDWSNR